MESHAKSERKLMKEAIQQAQTQVLSPIECVNKTIQEIISQPDDTFRIVFTNGCQLILRPILEFERQPEIFINTQPDPIDLINYGLLDESYRKAILKSNLQTEKTQCEQRLKNINHRLERFDKSS